MKKVLISDIGEIAVPATPDAWLEMVGVLATRMLELLPTEQDHWWFLVEQYDRSMSFADDAKQIIEHSPVCLYEIEFDGRRSENSYVGTPNPGVVFCQRVGRELERAFNRTLSEVVIANVYVSYARACSITLNELRLKYAVHFHNNCISTGSYGYADQWLEVIHSLGGN